MGFLDALFGRTKLAAPNLDRLFALPSASVTLQLEADLTSTGDAAVCFKPGTGAAFSQTQSEMAQILGLEDSSPGSWSTSSDEYGYEWVSLHADGFEELVTRVHMVNSSLESAGFGAQLLCSVFAMNDTSSRRCYLVYLYKRGTFYPFAPTGRERRDNETELRVRAVLAKEAPVEEDLSRWFPLWGLPI